MILMDSDHLTVLKYSDSERYKRLTARLAATAPEWTGTTIINVEEQMRGWLAAIAKEKSIIRQVSPYRELESLFQFLDEFKIASFSIEAAARFQELRSEGIRVATYDLKAACIALENDALFLTANRRDFEKVPGLKFENWLD